MLSEKGCVGVLSGSVMQELSGSVTRECYVGVLSGSVTRECYAGVLSGSVTREF